MAANDTLFLNIFIISAHVPAAIKYKNYDTQHTVITYRREHVKHSYHLYSICRDMNRECDVIQNMACLHPSCVTVTIHLQKAFWVTF